VESRLLTYFVAVAEELHFGRAAKRLNISQPPLSQQIIVLEEKIGVKLFTRTRRRVELTPAGQVLLEDARKILALTGEALRRTVRAGKGEIGRLSVGYIGSANYSILPGLIREFRRRYPEVELSLAELNTSLQIEALRDGRIHVGFMRPPRGLENEGLSFATVFRESLVAAIPASHKLRGRPSIPLRLLAGEPFIMIPRSRGPGFFDQVIAMCQSEGFSPEIALEASQFHTIIGMVAAGVGIAIVPASMQRSRMKGVVFREIENGLETSLTMAWSSDSKSPVLEKFIGVARELALS
jgi:DNA-binding transcriptional LysR family regulator